MTDTEQGSSGYPSKVTAAVNVGGTPMRVELDLQPYGPGNCPECGVPLDTQNPEAHAASHWGPTEPENDPGHYLARARRAVVLGRPLPTG